MKGEGGNLPENLGRDEPERRRRSASGRQHRSQLVEVLTLVVGERARRLHALEVWVYAVLLALEVWVAGKCGTGGEQERVDTAHPFALRYREVGIWTRNINCRNCAI